MSLQSDVLVYESTDDCIPVCRLCLSEESLEEIFEQEDLDLLISDFLTIVISKDDTISLSVCATCRRRLIEFREFKWRCLEVQELLQGNLYTVLEDQVCLLEDNDVQTTTREENFIEVLVEEVESATIGPNHQELEQDVVPTRKKKRNRFKRIEYTKSGRKRYVYDLTEIYNSQLVECSICGKMISKIRMEGHQNMHQGVRPFKCERGCNQMDFHCQQLRLHHYRNVHDGERHECDVCHKSYRSRRSLNYHTKDVHSVKPFACSVCSQAFSSNARLRQHQKYHNREKNHPCPKCSYSFYTNHDLKKHLKRHLK